MPTKSSKGAKSASAKKKTEAGQPTSVYFVSLGCPKNLVDSQVMLGLLKSNKFTVTEDPEKAETVIVNTCSFAMKSGGLTAGTAYTVSKAALQGLTFSLAREAVGFGVTVNGIAPAHVNTPMVTEQLNEAQRQAMLKTIPVGRFCEPEEFAHCVRFFVSPLSGFITGEILDLNGGLQFD